MYGKLIREAIEVNPTKVKDADFLVPSRFRQKIKSLIQKNYCIFAKLLN
jgi:hypothetical protein